MKGVSFEVAKAIKNAGYPQYGYCEEYYTSEGKVVSKFCDMNKLIFPAPTYLEVWLWLWREKGIKYEIVKSGDKVLCKEEPYKFFYMKDPEEAIIAAIQYIVENQLLK